MAAFQSIGPLTGTSTDSPPAFALYTGDLVAHDATNQMSQAYVENVELSVYRIFKSYINAPVYASLGVSLISSHVRQLSVLMITKLESRQ